MSEVPLDSEETAAVAEHAKPTGSRPSFFDAGTRRTTTISEVLEQFVILMPGDLLEESISRLQDAADTDSDTEQLLLQSLEAEQADAQLVFDDYQTQLQGFDSFRRKLQKIPGVEDPEAASLIFDIQRPIMAQVEERDRAYHRIQAAKTLDVIRTTQLGTPEEQAQRDSWVPVLEAYRR